jgi:hypothetical protein
MKTSHPIYRFSAGLFLYSLILSPDLWSHEGDNPLAVIDAGVQRSEDAPNVPTDFKFLPGEYVYFRFHVSGFGTKLNEKTEVKTLSMEYEITPQDSNHVALTEPVKGVITGDLSKEDKNWVPIRRTSFLLPSFVAAGDYSIHILVKDLVSKTEAVHDYPFQIGGVQASHADSIEADDFQFLRNQDDVAALELPAYAPGDTVFARFQMVGFKYEAGNGYKLSYGIKVLRPDGKSFLDAPSAAQISSDSFYPAPYVPGDLQITTPKNAARGTYQLTLTVRDLVGNQSFDLKRTFTIE